MGLVRETLHIGNILMSNLRCPAGKTDKCHKMEYQVF